jgi:hypothetical protein
MLARLKQWKYPKEFRIPVPLWPPELLTTLEELREVLESKVTQSSPPIAQTHTPQNEQLRFLADVGTGLWRLRQRMVQPGTNRPLEEMRRAFRDLESVWDALVQAGVEIQDHTNQPYDSGLSIKVIAFQPTPGMAREKIIETIKPTIYFKGQHIQMGEVVVATPEMPDGKEGQLMDQNSESVNTP